LAPLQSAIDMSRERGTRAAVEWRISANPVDYVAAVAEMDARAAAIRTTGAPELIWLLEHPPLYTGGTSARPADLLDPRFPVHRSGRGGQYTYHGPGQRVVYAMLDLDRRGRDIRAYVTRLEAWIIATLATFGVTGERRAGRVGIWVDRGAGKEDKIAAIGVRVRRWVTLHGLAINLAPDLGHFGGIVPCGVTQHGVTSLADLGIQASMEELDAALRATVEVAFPMPCSFPVQGGPQALKL
jgi:lipoyl(octanoyl) transferase